MAARMLDKSEPGTVAVTEGMWGQISAQFEAEDLGPFDIKGKGMISVFGIRPSKHHRAPVDGTQQTSAQGLGISAICPNADPS